MMVKVFVGALAFLFAMAPVAQEYKDTFTSVTPTSFDSGGAISRQFHLNAESYLPMATIARRNDPRKFIVAPNRALANQTVLYKGETSSFADYVAKDKLLDGVVVLHGGKIVFEAYPNMRPWQRHFAWSVTKVVTATALAVLHERQLVDMGAPVARYVPALAGSAWASIAVQDVANMASGIDCLDIDGYQDSTTCIYQHEESLGITAPTGREPDFIEHLRAMQIHAKAGTKTEYVSANTNVLMLVIEAVTGKPYALALQELVWGPIGSESDALVAISHAGYAYASGGLHARLRDMARFGQIYSQPGLSGVLAKATINGIQNAGIPLTPAMLTLREETLGADLPVRSGWQWDVIWSDGAMYKNGYLGQGIYVDPFRDLVVVWFGTGMNYDATNNSMLPVSRQIARADWRNASESEMPLKDPRKHK